MNHLAFDSNGLQEEEESV